MKVYELIEKLDFHDSCIKKISHEGDSIQITIDLCMWRQKGFKLGDDELKEIRLVFESIENYKWESDKSELDIDYDTIIKVIYENEVLRFVIIDGCTSVISFKCDEVGIVGM